MGSTSVPPTMVEFTFRNEKCQVMVTKDTKNMSIGELMEAVWDDFDLDEKKQGKSSFAEILPADEVVRLGKSMKICNGVNPKHLRLDSTSPLKETFGRD